jgi:hypothetical protein
VHSRLQPLPAVVAVNNQLAYQPMPLLLQMLPLMLMSSQAVLGARESLEGCFEVLQPQLADIDCSWQDFLWAVQVHTSNA